MHVRRTTFECMYFSMFIDYKAINYRTYGDNLKSVWNILAPFWENA